MHIFIIIILAIANAKENFTYSYSDIMIIYPSQASALTTTVIKRMDEYLEQGVILLNSSILSNSTFNIIVINVNSTNQCYNNYIHNAILPPSFPCTNYLSQSNGCAYYTNCQPNQDIQIEFTINPTGQQSQTLIFIQNIGTQTISVNCEYSLILLSSNLWFYWGVALTCLLILLIVILAGIAIYWSLKYKKTKKKFQHFKITGEQAVKKQ